MTRAKRQFQVSLLVDLEGNSAHRAATLRSAMMMRQECARAGIRAEFLVHAAPDDRLSRKILEQLPPEGWLEGADVSAWLKRAGGDYITLMSSPDVVSSNWIVEAMGAMATAEQGVPGAVIAHPESVFFPDLPERSSFKTALRHWDPRSAFSANPFGTLFLAHWETFNGTPLESHAFEGDNPIWKWVCDTLAAGVRHVSVPGTAQIVRTMEGAHRTGCLGADRGSLPGPSPWFKRPGHSGESFRAGVDSDPKPRPSLVAEFAEIAPDLALVLAAEEWRSLEVSEDQLAEADVFFEALGKFPDRLDYLVLHHFISTGGSEKETILSLNATRVLRPDLRVGVITTENKVSHWAHRLPASVRMAELGRYGRGVAGFRLELLLFRLLRQLEPKVINNVISPAGWNVFARWGRELVRSSKLLATEFCVNRNLEGDPESFAYSHLPECWEHVDLLLADNRTLLNDLAGKFGFDRSKVIHYPPMVKLRKPKVRAKSGLNVLWAGRISRQKRLDVLLKVARCCPEFLFHVYGSHAHDPEATRHFEELRFLPNVVIHEPFQDFEEIAGEGYDVLLYTSSWDGLPNILLEAMAVGMPVIAPDVGGIWEVVNTRTGYLVSHADAVEEFVSFLHLVETDPTDAFRRAGFARMLLAADRSWNSFLATWSEVLERFPRAQEAPRNAAHPPV